MLDWRTIPEAARRIVNVGEDKWDINDHGLRITFAAGGMGADARMFRPQQVAFPKLQVVEWIPPESRESIAHYAARLVEQVVLTPHTVLGGASFGGVVALEMAALIPVKKCLLIGSLRSPAGLRPTYRRLRHFSSLVSVAPICARVSLWLGRTMCRPLYRGVLRQLADADGRFLNWAVRALLEWQLSAGITSVAIRQIHGQRDWLLPVRFSQSDTTVPDAGHLLSLTHAEVVNGFIKEQLDVDPARLPSDGSPA